MLWFSSTFPLLCGCFADSASLFISAPLHFLLISPPSSQRHREEKAEIPPFLFSFFLFLFWLCEFTLWFGGHSKDTSQEKNGPPLLFSECRVAASRGRCTTEPDITARIWKRVFFYFLVKQHHSIASFVLLVDFIC